MGGSTKVSSNFDTRQMSHTRSMQDAVLRGTDCVHTILWSKQILKRGLSTLGFRAMALFKYRTT
jgi:hypothetical protein